MPPIERFRDNRQIPCGRIIFNDVEAAKDFIGLPLNDELFRECTFSYHDDGRPLLFVGTLH